MSLNPPHPATTPAARGKVCTDVRCATFLDPDTEICDECGGTQLQPLDEIGAMLCGWAGERPVVFRLRPDGPSLVGRSVVGAPPPDVDLRRFEGSGVVHRRHASIEPEHGEWQITHLGTNPVAVRGTDRINLETGATVKLRSGDALEVGDVVLEFVVRESPLRIGGPRG